LLWLAAAFIAMNSPGESRGTDPTIRRRVASVSPYDDVRGQDLSALDLSKRPGLLETLWFNEKTIWPPAGRMPGDPRKIMAGGMNPGLGIRALHRHGITGKGVSVAIIDQPLYLDHPEFKGKIAAYYDTGCKAASSMHGPAVASLLVGSRCGTAPKATLYFVVVPGWLEDTKYYAQAIDWIIQTNQTLPARGKIRVVSVSAAPKGPMWDEACARAESNGIMVLDCTDRRGFISPCFFDGVDREKAAHCTPGFPKELQEGGDDIRAPGAPRTTAEEYDPGQCSYQYDGQGGLSWSIPYCAGVMALGWQVRPDLTAA
jgi:subtilisin family serine protease